MPGFSSNSDGQSIMFARNADFSRSDSSDIKESHGLVQDGQLWIGKTSLNSGGTHIDVGKIVSNGTLTIGYNSPNITANISDTYSGQNTITTLGTITQGVWNGTTITVSNGGTGVSTLSTPYGVLCAGTTATGNVQTLSSLGASGTVLTSNGPAALPSFQTLSTSAMLITTYNSGSGNWTANASTKFVEILLIGGGGGGGSGRKDVSGSAGGGAGGGAGQVVFYRGPVSYFSGTIAYSVGGSVNGGTSISASTTNGNPGTLGNNTTFGSMVALGGNLGGGGINGAATGGSARAAVGLFTQNSTVGGGGNGGLAAGSNAIDDGGASFPFGVPTGGGGGGGGNTATARAGGTGGGVISTSSVNIFAPAAGGIETGTINGTGGSTSIVSSVVSSGLGGGGGGGVKAAAIGGNGGNGSAPGGGGGGGGGGVNSVGDSGAGGTGAAGIIRIVEYF